MKEQMTQAEAMEFFGVLYLGNHHVPKLTEFGYGWAVKHTGDLSTFDFDFLTRLVFLAHDRCIRAEVMQGGPRAVKIGIWKRVREGSMSQRHPTINAALDLWRRYYPEPDASINGGKHETK